MIIQLRTDHVVQVLNLVVFADQGGGESEFEVGLHIEQDSLKGLCRHDLHFVQNADPPLKLPELLEHLLFFPGIFGLGVLVAPATDHAVVRQQDEGLFVLDEFRQLLVLFGHLHL